MKKLLVLTLASAIGIGLLAGCGGQPAAENTGSGAPSGEATELTLWLPIYQFGDGISDADFWNEKLDAFEAEHNCTVNLEILSWSDYATVIYTGMLSGAGEGPDVVYVTETYDLIGDLSDLFGQ